MFPYKEEQHIYKDALDLKHPEPKPVATEHNLKQSKYEICYLSGPMINLKTRD